MSRHRCETQRPGDAVEPVAVRPSQALHRLAADATARGMHIDTAVSLVLERGLIEAELGHDAVALLDARAAGARVRRRLDGAAAAYLRMLMQPVAEPRSLDGAGTPLVLVPGRLWSRLEAQGPPPMEVSHPELTSALLWESAAMLEGLTMTEWAFRELARAYSARPSA